MADETEKRQLLKRIEKLQGLMRAAEHKISTEAHTLQKASSTNDVKPTALCKTATRTSVQQCPHSSSALKCTQINEAHDQLPQGHNSTNTHHVNKISDPDPSIRNSSCAVQVLSSQQCKHQMILQLNKGTTCVQTQSVKELGQLGNSRTGRNAEKVQTGNTHTTADIVIGAAGNLCDKIILQTSQNEVRTDAHRAREAAPVRSVKLTTHPSSAKSTIDQGLQTLASHTHSAQFDKDHQVTSTAIQLKQMSTCRGKTSGKECPSVSRSLPQAKTRKSLRKMQLALKNVQVIVAREAMQSKIDLFKSTLAQLEVKRNKKIEARKKAGRLKACSAQAGKSSQKDEKKVAEVAEKKICDVDQVKRDSEVVFMTGKHLNKKQSSVEQTENSSSLKTCTLSQCDGSQIIEEKARVVTKSNKSIVQHEGVCLTVPAKSSQSASTVDTKQDSTVVSKIGHTSLLKTSVKEDLHKELEATEDKLRDMRKKMGIMLKESSPKRSSSSSHVAMSHGQLKKSYQKPTSSSTTSISSTKPTSRLRPFVNRKSLRWTPEKSAQLRSPERVLVVGSSPNLRHFQLITGKTTFPKSANRPVLSPSFTNRLFCRDVTPTSKKSKYAFIRKPGQPVNTDRDNSLSKVTAFPVEGRQQMSAKKTFVHRYKLQRTSSDALNEQSISSDLARRSLIKSRYKLRTLSTGGASSQPCSFGLPLQTSALHRAARIVKSKYKLRKVPIVGSQNSSAIPWKQSFSVNNSWRSSHSFPVLPCNGRRVKLRNQKGSTMTSNHQFNHRRVSTGFSTPPGRFQQSTCYPASMNKGLWKQRGKHFIPSDWFWAIQQRKNRFLAQQTSKAAAREQWKYQTQWIVSPQWTKAYQTKTAMQQKKLLMKRLHWSRESNQLGRGQGPEAQKREQLVMINGIMYKSSSRRLTRASTSSLHGLTESNLRYCVSTSTPRAGTSSSRKLLRLNASRGKKTVMRVDFGGMTYVRTQEGVLEKDWQTRNIISRAKQRSISLAVAKLRRDNTKSKRKLCLFFSRFGKCSRGEQCPFVHDPTKIAVCTRFLRGTCHVKNCPFSHKVSKEKMPVCAFFMRGVCARDPCPYLHVKVSEGAEICPDFIAGFCDLAENCPKLHTLTCPQYSKSGTCPNGKKCHLHHRKLKADRTHYKDSSPSHSSENSIALASHQRLKRAAIPENQDQSEKQSSSQKKRCKTVDVAQSQRNMFGGSSLPLTGPSEHKVEEAPPLEQTGVPEPSVDCCGSKAVSPKKPLNLPAFISLLNYSAEESPTPMTTIRRGRKLMMDTGTSLQIKPRI